MHNMKTTLVLYIAVLFIGLTACNPKIVSVDSCNGEPTVLKNLTGLDGCSWVLELSSGEILEAINLAEFEITMSEGKEVRIKYEDASDYMTVCMAGKIVKLTRISEK